MTEKFHSELKMLRKDVLKMGTLAVEMLEKSVEALKTQDTELADWVLSKKKKLADMDYEIEGSALNLLTLYQPMAKDMRTIACILKMITYLTRVGRYGKDIANLAKGLSDQPHIAKLVSIPHMGEIACGMLKDALEAFEREDISLIQDFSERDDSLDALRYSIFRECVSYMIEDPKKIERCSRYIMLARYLERCGDHACKMAEKIYYMITGERQEIK